MDNGGRVTWNLDVDSGKFDSKLRKSSHDAKAFAAHLSSLDKSSLSSIGSKISHVGDSVASFGNKINDAGQKIGNMGSSINRVAVPAAVALGAGFGIVSKMAFDQVNSVQQATLALRAYEKDGTKVNKVLSDLLGFARSDLGVLFNRKDLFAAAQQLKIMGAETDQLTDYVKIMSRSVGLGLSTWDGLGIVIKRVGSTGKLYADDLQYLQSAGFKLDSSLSGTSQTFETLFQHLDKGIPVDALDGQANTIKGIGVRVQTAFRGIGEAILGVDKDTGQFIKGGAGDQLVTFFKNLPAVLNEPKMKEAFKNIGQSIADFAQNALPKIISFIEFVGRNIETITKLTVALLAFGTSMKVAGMAITALSTAVQLAGFAVKGFGATLTLLAAHPVILAIAGVAALAAGMMYLSRSVQDTAIKTGSANVAMSSWQAKVLSFISPTGELTAKLQAQNGALLAVKNASDAVKASQDAVKVSTDALGQAQLNLTGASLGVERAQRNYNEAVAQYGPQSLEAREANHYLAQAQDGVAKAAADAKQKEQEKASKEQELAKNKEYENNVRSQNVALSNQGGVLSGLIGMLGAWASAAASSARSVTSSLSSTLNAAKADGRIPGHAKGIMNSPGGLAIVGEKGPELVNLPKGSDVFSNETSRRMASSIPSPSSLSGNQSIQSSPSSNINIEINLKGVMARSRSELRDIGVDIVESINEGLRAKNLPEIGGGKLMEVSTNG